ncbi:MAG: response regulator [Pseudomonadales bacterium]|nr:response regulator [Pseudomonadales bacterium]
MNLATKLVMLFSALVVLIVGGMNYFVLQNISNNEYTKLNSRLSADSLFAANRIIEKNNSIKSVSKAIAKIRTIPIALDLYESRGVNQVLNDQISIYEFVHYILVLENDGTVFASSTRDHKHEKLQGEQLLLLNATEHPLYSHATSNVTNGPVGEDHYLNIIGKTGGLSQWYIVPIKKRGVVVGSIVVSIDWEYINLQLLNSIVLELESTGNPISAAFITGPHKKLMLFSSGSKPPSDKHSDTDLVRFSPLGGQNNLLVHISYDPKMALRPIRVATQNIIFTTLLGAILLGLSLLFVIGRFVLKPLAQLNRSVQIIGEGNLRHRVNIPGRDEVASLGQRVNQMASSLGEKTTSIDLLNREVDLRQLALQENQLQEAELAEIRIYIDNITDNVPQFLAYVDNEERYQFVNLTYLKWLDKPNDFFIGFCVKEIHSQQLYEQINPYISRAIAGELVSFEVHIETGKMASVTYTPHFDEQNSVIGFFSSMDDITHIKEAENAMRSAKQAAEDSMLAKSQFLASMSHEIRTPMNGVLGMLTILKHGNLSETQDRQVAIAEKSANSLLNIINDILDFSKIDAGKINLEMIEFNLQEMIDDFSMSMAVLAENKQLELIVDTTELSEVIVKGDPIRIQQILQNLVGNAIKFTHSGEVVITARLKKAGGNGIFLYGKITDTGIGIPEDKVSTLFESFTQADASTTREYGGTGLGLTISKQLAELMGGGVRASSVLGEGSTFEFSVLLQRGTSKQAPEPAIFTPEKNILIVDDNQTNRNVLARQLKCWGIKTLQASGAAQAKLILENTPSENPVSMMLVDMHMPEVSGLALAKQLRSIEEYHPIPILLMASISDNEDMHNLGKIGIQGIFHKPVTRDDLLKVVEMLQNNGQSHSPAANEDKTQSTVQEHVVQTNRVIKILLVEDDLINQEVATTILKNHLNVCIDIANNGQEAIDALKNSDKENPYDVVLMDCQMPKMDGFTATREIRNGNAGDANQDMAIIAMTANAMKGDKEKCMAAGMNDYLSKPIQPSLLAEKISRWT